MITLELSIDDAEILRKELGRRIEDLDRELAGTSKLELQHELAANLRRLQEIRGRLGTAPR